MRAASKALSAAGQSAAAKRHSAVSSSSGHRPLRQRLDFLEDHLDLVAPVAVRGGLGSVLGRMEAGQRQPGLEFIGLLLGERPQSGLGLLVLAKIVEYPHLPGWSPWVLCERLPGDLRRLALGTMVDIGRRHDQVELFRLIVLPQSIQLRLPPEPSPDIDQADQGVNVAAGPRLIIEIGSPLGVAFRLENLSLEQQRDGIDLEVVEHTFHQGVGILEQILAVLLDGRLFRLHEALPGLHQAIEEVALIVVRGERLEPFVNRFLIVRLDIHLEQGELWPRVVRQQPDPLVVDRSGRLRITLAPAEQEQVCPDLVPVGRGKLIDVPEEQGPRLAALAAAVQRQRPLHPERAPVARRPGVRGLRQDLQGLVHPSLTAEIVGQSARKLGTFWVLRDRLLEERNGLVYLGVCRQPLRVKQDQRDTRRHHCGGALEDRVEVGPVPLSLGKRLLLLEPGLGQAHQERRLVGAGRQSFLEFLGRLFGLGGQQQPAEELPQYQRLGIELQRRAVSLRGPFDEVPLLFLATRHDQVDMGLEAFGQPASCRLQALDRAAETPRVLVLDSLQELE